VTDVLSVEDAPQLDLPNLQTLVLKSSPWHLPFANLIKNCPNLETLGMLAHLTPLTVESDKAFRVSNERLRVSSYKKRNHS
jgi:hypothetical protein